MGSEMCIRDSTEAAAVHGISDAEIAQGPNFVEAWTRFLLWTEALLNTSIQEDVWDSDDDEPRAPRLEETPVLLLAAHNGARASVCLTYLCERVDRVCALTCQSSHVSRRASTFPFFSAKLCVMTSPVRPSSVGFS